MDFHRLGVDMGFKRVEGIRKRWDGVSHGVFLLTVSSLKRYAQRSIAKCKKTG
jgi:hypothetical protein